jgi:sulfur-oxidizing protein SoxA
MSKKNRLLSTLIAGALSTLTAGGVSAEGIYREYFPSAQIDPSKGVMGDMGFSDTVKYWKDAQTLDMHKNWIGDLANEWKLNVRFMDLDRASDFHEGHAAVDDGARYVKNMSKMEPEFLTCLGEGKTDLKGAAAKYPKYDEKLGRIMTVESRVEHCAKTALWRPDIKQGSPINNAITMYVKAQSTGMPVQVDIQSKPVMEAYKRGEQVFYTKAGQLNLACASCHTPQGTMGQKLRGQVPTTPFGDAAAFPLYRSPLGEIESLHKRFAICNKQSRTMSLKPGDPAYIDLEVFYTVLANGYPVSVPSMR